MKIVFISSDIILDPNLKDAVILSLTDHPIYDNIVNLIPIIPPPDIDYDSWYWQYVLTYTYPFLDLMRVVYPLYEGKDVYIITPMILEEVAENISRFLYNRYDFAVSFVRELDDLNFIQETDFSVRGLDNIDKDKIYMCELYAHEKPFIPIPQPTYQSQALYRRL